MLAVGLVLSETPSKGEIVAAMALAVVSSGVSDIFFRTGTALATNTAVTTVVYLTPVLALIWIQLISGLNIQNVALTAVGIAAIVGGNGMIAVDGARRRSSPQTGNRQPRTLGQDTEQATTLENR